MQNYSYYDQVAAQLQRQAQKIAELDSVITQLKNELSEVKNERQIHVDKIEYKFDQLKIETLSGTLNVGISPAGGKQIEDMIVEGKEIELSDPRRHQLFQRVKEQIDEYMNSECHRDLQFFEAKHQVIFGQDYREAMIMDIRGQVDKRIEFYMDKLDFSTVTENEQGEIFEKVKRDIMIAIERHVISKKGNGEGQT